MGYARCRIEKASDPGYLVPGTWYLASLSRSHISNLSKVLHGWT
jgi:hypothetical protein